MHIGKKANTFRFLLKAAFLVCLLCCFSRQVQAQANNLMIVEYVDWNPGSGFAIKIYNPTASAINLSNYRFRVYSNGDANNYTNDALSGVILAKEAKIISNAAYPCSSDIIINSLGVNGNEVVAITTAAGAYVDMIGRVGFTALSNNNSQRINGMANALYWNRIIRNVCNVARYTLSTDSYNPNNLTVANIWPDNQTTNVVGWSVVPVSCIPRDWNPDLLTLFAGPDQNLICPADNIVLNAAVTLGATVQWSGGKGTFSNPTGISTTYTPSPADNTRIKLSVKAVLACEMREDQVIVINGDSTAVTLHVYPQTNFACPQDSIPLKAIFPKGIIKWTGGKGKFLPADNVANPVYVPSPADHSLLKLRAIVSAGNAACPKTAFQELVFQNGDSTLLKLNAGPGQTFNCPRDSITVLATITGNASFEWQTNGKGNFKDKTAFSTWYYVAPQDITLLKFTARAVSGVCALPFYDQFTVLNGDSTEKGYEVFIGPQKKWTGQEIVFNIQQGNEFGNYSGTWFFGDGDSLFVPQGQVTHIYSQPGTYTVEVNFKSKAGCPQGKLSRQLTITVPIIPEIPNIFTPNNDGLNDTFKPVLPETSLYNLKIYNRWGQLIFESHSPDKVWDGKGATDGVYFAHLQAVLPEGEILNLKSPVTVLR